VIHRGTTEAQRTVTGTLADIAERAAEVPSPGVIVIGEVVALRSALDLPLLDALAIETR
jgi:uroporphyrin-III C-methyltransferase/precorrin-2 dehydrogenase/sirohydrochlorin ferrochelatase